MTAVGPPVGVTGLMGEFAAAEVLLASDVRVALALGRLAGETDEQVLLAAALTVRALRLGSVCADLTQVRASAVQASLLDPPDALGPAPRDHVKMAEYDSAWLRGHAKPHSAMQGVPEDGADAGNGADAGDVAAATDGAAAGSVAAAGYGAAASDGAAWSGPATGSLAPPLGEPDLDALPWPEPHTWLEACARSPMVATEPPPPVWQQRPRTQARPLVLDGPRLYLDRYAQLEHLVRTVLTQRAHRDPPQVDPRHLRQALGALDDGPAPTGTGPTSDQRLAVAAAVTGWVTVIAGGPGTGKTWTVGALLATLDRLATAPAPEAAAAGGHPAPRVALAAPTGKAAARMQEQTGGRHEAMTIHRLLGAQPWRGLRFRHDWQNRLPYDVVVVDETSMVSLELMARLLEALPTTCRLVLVGDPDQLASVDAGAVLADLVERPPRPAPDPRERLLGEAVPHDLTASALTDEGTVRDELRRDLVRLRHNRRAERAIATLAEAIRRGDGDAVLDALRGPAAPGEGVVEWVPVDPAAASRASLDALREDVASAGAAMVHAARRGDAAAALAQLGRHRLLCAHRSGLYGVSRWRDTAAGWVAASAGRGWLGDEQTFPVGRPLLVTENDRALGLWNGDTGVVVATEDGVTAVVDRGGGRLLSVPVSRLPAVQTPLALTVHKAQGGEADRVSVVLPPPDSPLLTRELLYTAVTRARHLVRLVGTEESVRAAVARRVVRASGLREGWPGLSPEGPAASAAGTRSPARPSP